MLHPESLRRGGLFLRTLLDLSNIDSTCEHYRTIFTQDLFRSHCYCVVIFTLASHKHPHRCNAITYVHVLWLPLVTHGVTSVFSNKGYVYNCQTRHVDMFCSQQKMLGLCARRFFVFSDVKSKNTVAFCTTLEPFFIAHLTPYLNRYRCFHISNLD